MINYELTQNARDVLAKRKINITWLGGTWGTLHTFVVSGGVSCDQRALMLFKPALINFPHGTAITISITDFGSKPFSVTGSLFYVFATDELTALFAVECNGLDFLFSPDEPASILMEVEETILLILPQDGHISITQNPFYNYAAKANF